MSAPRPQPRFVLFGGPRVWRGGLEVEVGPPQQQALLALLLAAGGRSVALTEIVDALWGADPSASAVNLVHRYVGALRRLFETDLPNRAVGRWLVRTGSGYRLAVDEDCADLPRFRALVAAGRAEPSVRGVELLTRALELAQGPAAAGVVALREHPAVLAIEQERVAAATDAADLALCYGGASLILAGLRRLAAEHPLDEPVHARLVLLLADAGRYAEALTAYGLVRDRLADELGIDPSPVLREAYQSVLARDRQAPDEPAGVRDGTAPVRSAALPESSQPGRPPRPAQLPAAPPMFTGREAEIAAAMGVLDRAASESVAIVTIGGMAGVGKTSLAVYCAHRLAPGFPDGQVYVNLRGFDQFDRVVTPDDALRGLLEALGVATLSLPDTVDDRAALYRSLVAGRRLLIVLDNARDSEQVRPLLPGTPGCLVLVTSRNRLTSLIVRDGARPLHLVPLAAGEARELLAGRLGAARVREDPKATDQIIAACAGLPLALAIVSARAAATAFSMPVIAAELREAGRALDAFTGEDEAADIRAVFSWSHGTLSPSATRLFGRLAVHPGPEISAAAAASIAGLPAGEVRAALAELTTGNLLIEAASGRYTLHDLLRAHATELLTGDDRDDAQARVMEHYIHSTRAARLAYGRPPAGELPPARDGVVAERPTDIAAAVRWYLAERAVLTALIEAGAQAGAHRSVVSLVLDWRPMNQAVDSARDTLPYALLAARAAAHLGDPILQAETDRDVAVKYGHLRQFAEADLHYRRALSGFLTAGDPAGESNTLRNMAGTAADRGRPDEALIHARDSLAAARRSGSQTALAVAMTYLVHHLTESHLDREALEVAEQASELLTTESLVYLEGSLLHNRGMALRRMGETDAALECFEQALSRARSQHDVIGELGVLEEYGEALLAAGRPVEARATWVSFLELAERFAAQDNTQIWELPGLSSAKVSSIRARVAEL